MVVMQVSLEVKSEWLADFIEASLENAHYTRQEAGNLRFDFFQSQDEPTHFVLFEIYQSPEAQQEHRNSAHFQTWREKTLEMVVNRAVANYKLLFPASL